MRYRPFGQAGVSVSAVAFTVDDRAAQRGAEALAGLIFAAMEAGVNAFHLESCEPEVLETVGRSLAAVERRLLFVSLRLGPRPGLTCDFSPDALTGAIDQALFHTGLERLDLVLLDAPGEDELSAGALTALKQARTSGRVGLLGVAGAHEGMDGHLGGRAFDVLASPHHPRSGWDELNRLKKAAYLDMGVIAYDYFPELFRQASTTPGTPQKRSLLDAIVGTPELHPLAGAGTFAFLHNTRSWTAEELCLACALMEPSVSTVLIRAHELERLEALAAVPDRDLPPGLAAKVEMARFGMEPAAEPDAGGASSKGGVSDAIKAIVAYLEGFSVVDTYVAPRPKVTEVSADVAGVEASGAKGRSKNVLRDRTGERRGRLWPMPKSSVWVKTAPAPTASSRAESGAASGPPLVDATPPPPLPAAPPSVAQPQAAIWRSKDYDYPVQLTGESFPGPDGRTYLKVNFDGSPTFVPADEIILPQDTTPPELDDSEALQALQARVAKIAR